MHSTDPPTSKSRDVQSSMSYTEHFVISVPLYLNLRIFIPASNFLQLWTWFTSVYETDKWLPMKLSKRPWKDLLRVWYIIHDAGCRIWEPRTFNGHYQSTVLASSYIMSYW